MTQKEYSFQNLPQVSTHWVNPAHQPTKSYLRREPKSIYIKE